MLPSASFHQCIKHRIATFPLNASFYPYLSHYPLCSSCSKVRIIIFSWLLGVWVLHKCCVLLRTHSELRTCFILPNKSSRGALNSKAVFLRVQSETFSFVRIIIMPYVWYKDTLSVRASFKSENQSKPLGQAIVVQCPWKKWLSVDSRVWVVDPTPQRAPGALVFQGSCGLHCPAGQLPSFSPHITHYVLPCSCKRRKDINYAAFLWLCHTNSCLEQQGREQTEENRVISC